MSEKEERETKYPPILPIANFSLDRHIIVICKEYTEFRSWLQERFPYLFPITFILGKGENRPAKGKKRPPDGTTPADMDEAIILISEEYARRRLCLLSPPPPDGGRGSASCF
jgi:hypothetical protein